MYVYVYFGGQYLTMQPRPALNCQSSCLYLYVYLPSAKIVRL